MTETIGRYGLSKSKITMFEQCPKRLWLSVHRRELAEQDAGAEARFSTGHEVGAVACALLPDGVMIEAEPDLAAALTATRALLDAGHDRPIFEATLEHEGTLVRIDVLEPDGRGGWRNRPIWKQLLSILHRNAGLRLIVPCGYIVAGIPRR